MVNVTNDESFKSDIIESDSPVLVEFFANWCTPCFILSTILEEVSEEINIFKIDIDANPITASKYNITSVPTVIMFNNGNVIN